MKLFSITPKAAPKLRIIHILAFSILVFWTILTSIYYAVPFLHQEGFKNGYLSYFADDFFYYLVIARNSVVGTISSFDTIHLTNGYHPLWQIFLTMVYAVVPSEAFLIGTLLVVLFMLNLAATWLCWRLLGMIGVSTLAQSIGTLIFHISCFRLFRMGMEVALAVPICLLTMLLTHFILIRPKSLYWMILGLSHALLILSRLDAVLFSILLLLFTTKELLGARIGARLMIRGTVLFMFGLLPLIGYLIFNLVNFESFMPLSGQAKHLKDGLFFSVYQLKHLIPTLKKLLFPSLAIAVEVLGLLVMIVSWRRKTPFMHIVFGSVFFFPVLFYIVSSLASDWMLWYWYFYPLALLLPFGIGIVIDFVLEWRPFRLIIGVPLNVLIAITAFIFALYVWRFSLLHLSPSRNSIFISAKQISEFGHTHPGRYAMGDRAGLTTWLLNRPVIQMEGLVADRYMLQAIVQQEDLIKVLQHYHVNYYIATQGVWEKGCYLTTEPKITQAGPNSPKMTGRFCNKPVFSVDDGQPPGPWKITSFIFALGQK